MTEPVSVQLLPGRTVDRIALHNLTRRETDQMTTDFYQFVDDFHNKFGQVRYYQDVTPETWKLRRDLVVEEAREFAEAMDSGDVEAAIKEACDLLYVTFGFFVALGHRPDEFFREVQYANMSKVDESGRPVLSETGKVLKEGTRYFKPSFKHLLSSHVMDHFDKIHERVKALLQPETKDCPCGRGFDTDGDGDCPACARREG